MMKRFALVALVAVSLFSLTACNKSEENTGSTTATESVAPATESMPAATSDVPAATTDATTPEATH